MLIREVNELEKEANLIRKISTIMHVLKANSLYSAMEIEKDKLRLLRGRADAEEVDALLFLWALRRELALHLIKKVMGLKDTVKISKELAESIDKDVKEVIKKMKFAEKTEIAGGLNEKNEVQNKVRYNK